MSAGVRIVLVRHGEPDGTWGRDPDPGLNARGHEQAQAVAERLRALGPLPIVVSPLRRTTETAAPLASLWGVDPRIDAAVGELVAPTNPAPDHATWLRNLMAGRAEDAPEVMHPFRARVLRAVCAITEPTVFVTHFLAINAVVGGATGDDRVVSFAPAHCSRTVVELSGGALSLVSLGETGSGRARV